MSTSQVNAESAQISPRGVVSGLREGGPRALITFAGQGIDFMTELVELWGQGGVARELIEVAAARTKQAAQDPAFVLSGLHDHGYDLARWITQPQTRPAEAYLQSTAVSIPLIFAAQVARYAQAWEGGLREVFARGGVAGLTGHSQGIVAALLVAERADGGVDAARFGQLVEVLLWEGLHMAQSYHAALRGVGASGQNPPMVAVSGPELAVLESLVALVNRGQAAGHHLVVSLQNGRTRNVVSGPPALMDGLHKALTARAEREEAARKASKLGGRALRFTWEPLSVGGAYHGPMMGQGAVEMRKTIARLGFRLDAGALKHVVFSSDSGVKMNDAADLTEEFVACQFLRPVRWHKTLVEAHAACGYTEILDFGPADGVARLSAGATRGLGVRVHALATAAGRMSAWVTPADEQEQPLDYARFKPQLVRYADGQIGVDNVFSRATGRSPAILPGMTPTTVDVPIVAAAANAGFMAELAGGGQVTEAMFRRRCIELSETLSPGQEVVFNGLYLDPYLWDLHIRKTGLVQQLRREGAPICGVTISAGVPELKEAVALLDELVGLGIWLNAFKPGSVEQIRQVCAIAQARPQHRVFVHVEGGKAGGHHSWEELEQLLLETYHQLRACENVVICVGGGVATPERGVELLTGRWSVKHGQPEMPVDALLLGTVTMAAREATATRSVKEALVSAPGAGEWVFAGEVRGGVTSGKSQLNADIHYLDNAASRAGRLLDEVAGDEAKVSARRGEIIEALSKTCKPYFGDVEQMTYLQVLERMVELMAIGQGSAYEDGRWLDVSHRRRMFDLIRRFEARLIEQEEGAFEPQLKGLGELDEPEAAVARFAARYPVASSVLVHPMDAEFFVQDVCARPGKPVNFVPVIDAQVRRWYKSDSLWQAQHPRYSADQVLIIPGPEAVSGIGAADEPVAEILARFDRALVDDLTARGVAPVEGVGGALERALAAPRVFDGRAMVANPLRELLGRAMSTELEIGRAISDLVDIVRDARGQVVSAAYVHGGQERVTLTVEGSRVRVAARPQLVALEGAANEAELVFELVSHVGADGAYVVMDGAAYHLAVQKFYQRALFGRELVGAALHEEARVGVEVRGELVRGYGRVTQLAGLSEGESPMPYGFSLVWEAVFEALSAPELAPGLLKLVHLSNRFEPGPAWPLVAGQRAEAVAQVVRVADDARGRTIEVVSRLEVGGVEALRVTSAFYVRDSFAHLPLGKAVSEAPQRNNVDIIKGQISNHERRDVEMKTLAVARGVAPGTLAPFSMIGADRNPIHSSPLMAQMAGLDGCIVHGMWTAARAYASLVDDALGGHAGRIAAFDVSFLSPCMPAAALTITTRRVGAEAQARQRWQVEVSAAQGDATVVVMRADALIKPPKTAYVFPGQGIQQRGMGMEGYARSRSARGVWDRADAFTREELGFSILHVVRDNPSQLEIRGHKLVHERGVLHLTQLTQVAMAVLSLAQIAELREAGLLQDDAVVCGHSVGEYNALGSLDGVLPMEVVVRTVYERGLAMHRLVPRDEAGESGYRMGVIRPHYVGMSEQQARDLVASIARSTSMPLEIVNYNIKGRQYSVVGRIESIQALRDALDALPQRGGPGKPAWVDVPGVDVPFHSRVLSDGVAPFRATLEERFPQELPIERLLGRYIPNLVPRPFSLDRAFIEEVRDYTGSAPLTEALNAWSAWSAQPAKLARRLLIELLSWQFASPVRWIETQDLLLTPLSAGGLGVERIVEVGVGYQPTLTNMARYTKELLGAAVQAVEVLNSEADADQLFMLDGDPEEAPAPAAAPAAEAPQAPAASAPAVVVAAPVAVSAGSGAPVADEPLTVREALRALIAVQARVRPEQLDAKETIDEVFEGVSSRRNQVLLDIGAEFALGTIDGAHEKPLAELEAEIGRRAARYAAAGRYLRATTDEAIKHQLGRAGMGRKEALAYLDSAWGMGPKIADAALVTLALGRREGDSSRGGALATQGAAPAQDKAAAHAALDAAAQALGASRGLALSKRGAGGAGAGGAVDSAVVDALADRIIGPRGVLMQTARDMAEQLGHKLDAATPAAQADAAALARLAMLEREHGADYAQLIAPMFDALKHVAFISPWAWRQRDAARVAYDGLNGKIDAAWRRRAQRLQHQPDARMRRTASWFARWAASHGAADEVVRALEGIRDAHGERGLLWSPARPALVEEAGAVRYEEREDHAQDARERFVEALRIGQPGAHVSMSAHEDALHAQLKDACRNGFDLAGRVALVTGASPGSIALEMVAHLLHSGAIVVLTTTTYNKNRLRFYRKFYQDHAGEGAELHVVPCNQGSAQDVEALVNWLFATVTEQAGAAVKVVKRPMAPALVLPFGAIKDLATLDQLGAGAEAAMRAMLLNVERLVAKIAVKLRAQGMPERPCHVVLPLSPNHGAFGGDGAYAETKAALEVMLEKWSSEREAWGSAVTLCGARIGWVRGTGLMSANNLVSPGLEAQTGVRTFSSPEMAFLLTALCTDEARDASLSAPLRVDLTGGFGGIADLKGVVGRIRAEVEAKLSAARAAQAPVSETLQALPMWPMATFGAAHAMRLPAAPPVVPLESMVVLVGAGEVGPFGSARTRFAFEVQDELAPAAVLELAWTCGLVRYEPGERGGAWVDGETGEQVAEAEIAPKYREKLRERVGIRFVEPETLGLDPRALPVMTTAYLERDMTFAAASEAEAREFERMDPARTVVVYDADREQWRVTRRAGSAVRVPRAVKLDRDVAGIVPRGYDLARYGIPRDMIENVDRLALFNLIATVEAFLSAGVTPEELLSRIHPARVANTQGSGIGGMRSLHRLYCDHLLGVERQKDILQETLINVVAAYVVQSYVGSYGAMSHPVAACATAAVSVEEGVDKILAGKADFVVAGGFDDIGREGMVGFADMNATANADDMRSRGLEPDEFSRANDVRRRGFVEAQGGGTMLLARADVALRLGLPVRAVVGYAASFSDGIQKSIPAPGLGAIACVLGKEQSPLAQSLARFGLTTDDVAVVYKHDTSTQANDPNENRLHDAIQRYLDRTAGNPLWVVSQKTITGHAKGGSAAWQAIGLAQALATGVIPGNRNLDAVDPAMAAFEHMAFTDSALHVGADVLEAGLLTSLGFGHVSGIVLLLHPRHFLAQVPAEARAAYLARVAEREAFEQRALIDAMTGRAPLYERRAERRFEGADGSEQQHAEEIALLTSLMGHLDPETGIYSVEAPQP